jgi:restriction system protein
VKLKIAENSLFATLLRSPWWMSFAAAAALALISLAALPSRFVVFGLMTALPFLIIGIIATFRQLRAPSARTVEQTLQRAATMPWREFGDTLEQAYRQQGFTVTRIEGQAADLQLIQGAQTTLVTGRRWKAGSHGVEPLRALDKARQALDASHCVYITLAEPKDTTRRFAEQNAISLLSGPALVQLLGSAR